MKLKLPTGNDWGLKLLALLLAVLVYYTIKTDTVRTPSRDHERPFFQSH